MLPGTAVAWEHDPFWPGLVNAKLAELLGESLVFRIRCRKRTGFFANTAKINVLEAVESVTIQPASS